MTQPNNLLPHNPLNATGLLDELRKLKGDKSWIHFELELLCSHYPDNAVFNHALEKVSGKVEVRKPRQNKQSDKPQATNTATR